MTVNLNHVANQVTTTGSDTNVDLDLNPKGAGAIKFTSASTNYIKVTGAATGFAPTFAVAGSDTNIGLVLQTKNNGSVTVQNDGGYPAVVLSTSTSGRTVTVGPYGIVASGFNTDIPYDISSKGKSEVSLSTQYGAHLKAGRTDSATNSIVNYVQVSGGYSGAPVSLNALGSDTNVQLSYYSKGTGTHSFYTSASANPQFAISPTASSASYLQVSSAVGFGVPPTLSSLSIYDDMDISLAPKGAGMVKTSGTGIKLSGSSSGYVGLKGAAAAGSTTYTLPAADGTSGQVLSTNGSGVMSWATAGGGGSGRVLQVVSTSWTNNTTTASASYIDVTGGTLTITPASSSSKFFLSCTLNAFNDSYTAGNISFVMAFVRNGTVVYATRMQTYNDQITIPCAMEYLDSPATASAITYKIQIYRINGSNNIQVNNTAGITPTSTITAMEVS